MHYDVTPKDTPQKELWQEKTVHRLSGGFNIVGFASFASLGRLPKGIALNINFATRNATPIKGAVLQANLGASDTTAKILKNGLFAVGDFIGNAANAVQITAINTSNAAYDELTLSAAIGAVTAGGVLHSATALGAAKILPATGLNYADVKWQPGAFHCSCIIQAYEVTNAYLPYPLTTTQKTELTSRFFIV